MAYMGPAFNTFDVNFNFSDLVLDAGDIAENGDLLQYDLANAQWLTVSNLTIPGDLIVNGTTTTVNSTTVTIDDPIFTLGGDVAPTVTDALDRGIEFRWHDGVNAKTGFFGFDNGTGSFTFIPDATNTNEVFTGTPGSVNFYDANFSGNTAIKIPVGGTADRPTALQGQLRYNTDLNQFEGYDGTNWAGLGGIIDADQDTYIDAEQTADDDTLRFYTAGVERMTIDGTGTINFNGGLELGLQETVTGDLSTTATTQVTLDSWPTTSYRSAKYMLQAIDKISNEYHVSELMIIHDSSTAFATEYGTIHTGSAPLASYDVDVDSNNVRLRTTPASANFTNFKFTRNALTPEPTFALSASSSNINEGDSVTITLTTTHVSNNNQFAYTVTGVDSSDLSAGSLTGVFTINNNTATTSFTLANDATTEGSETLTLTLDNGQANVGVVIGDTSLDPTYTLSADNTTINEGDTVTITLTTTEVPDATTVAYTVTGVNTSDLSAGTLTGNFTITSNTGTVQFTLAEDATTEGVETLTLALDNGGDSINISITDTSADSTTQDYVADDYVVDGFVTSPAASGGTGTIDEAIANSSNPLLTIGIGSPVNTQWFDFNGDGTDIFIHNIASNTYVLNRYNLSTAYDLTTATYSNNEYYGGGNDYDGKFSGDGMRFYNTQGMHNLASAYEPGNNIQSDTLKDGPTPGSESFAFSSDGTKLYGLAKSNIPNGVVYSEGTTPWDTNTFSLPGGALAGNTFNYGNEMTGASNIEINSTGTKLYILTRYSTISGTTNPTIVEYDFTTPYDITTLTYNGKYLSLGADGFLGAERITFRLENDNLIFVKGPNTNHSNNTQDVFYQYTIPAASGGGSGSSTDWNVSLSNVSYDSKSLSVSSQDFAPHDVATNADGTKIYMIGNSTDTIYEYDLSTANDISTASYNNVSYRPFGTTAFSPRALVFSTDGTKMYMLEVSSSVGSVQEEVHEYDLSTAFDLSTVSYSNVKFDISSQLPSGVAVRFNNDGTRMFCAGGIDESIYQYDLSTAWDVSTASYNNESYNGHLTQQNNPMSICFSGDGTKMYIIGQSDDIIYQYGMTTAFDVTTASYDNISFSVTNQEGSGSGITFSRDGTKLFYVGYTTDTIYQYSTGVGSGGSSGSGIDWGGDRAIIWGSNGGSNDGIKIDYFDITTPGNASTFGDVHRQVDGFGPGKHGGTCVSDTTYGVYAGGQSSHNLNPTDQIDYITISTLGNSADFGSLTTKQMRRPAGGSDGTTGYIAGGQDDWTGATYYTGCDTFTIATPGNATLSSFTLSTGTNQTSGTNDATRMIIAGGYYSSNTNDNTIQYFTFASAGTSQDFGDLTVGRGMTAATSDNTYALIGGGQDRIGSTQLQSTDVVTIQTTGNATNFGNLVSARRGLSAVSNGTYACFCAGVSNNMDIDQFTIATPGNATDFGDLVSGGESPGACSGNAS